MERISGPPHQLSGARMCLGLGPLPVLKTLRDKEPFYRRRGIQKERVIVPLGGRWHRAIRVSGADAPAFNHGSLESNSTVRTSTRSGSWFLNNPGWDYRWFHHPGAPLRGFRSWAPGPDRTFGDSQSASSRGRACSHRAGLGLLDSVWPFGCSG